MRFWDGGTTAAMRDGYTDCGIVKTPELCLLGDVIIVMH